MFLLKLDESGNVRNNIRVLQKAFKFFPLLLQRKQFSFNSINSIPDLLPAGGPLFSLLLLPAVSFLYLPQGGECRA